MYEWDGQVKKKSKELTEMANALPLVVDIKQAADLLSLSPWTLRRWIAEGKLKAVRLGRRVMLRSAELERLVEQGLKPKPEARD
jgi:excisionase family DNA binding protein